MSEHARRPATLVLPPLPYALALLASWRLHRDFLALPWEFGAWNGLFAWGLMGGGLLLFFWTFWAFHRHRTTVNPYRAARCVVTDGPFRFSRNPIYVGDWFIYVGMMFWLQTWWPVLFAPLVWGIIHFGVIRHEEAHLEARFGDEYRHFKAHVRRWL